MNKTLSAVFFFALLAYASTGCASTQQDAQIGNLQRQVDRLWQENAKQDAEIGYLRGVVDQGFVRHEAKFADLTKRFCEAHPDKCPAADAPPNVLDPAMRGRR